MNGPVQVACCQLAPDVLDPEASAERARTALSDAIDGGAQIVVLPELVNSGYVLASTEEARRAAAPVDGELLRGWAAEAARGDAIVIGGFAELADDGRVFNSSALVDGSGVRAVYRKLHLWGEEPRWFVPGEAPAPIVETKFGRIGLGVCYDIEFPELTRGLALAGADLLALPTNWPHGDASTPPGMLTSLALTTGYLSGVFVAVCDRCGTERGLEFEGGSVIAGADGRLLAGPVPDRGAATITALCDLSAARDKAKGRHNNAFADRRPAHYAPSLVR